MKKPHWNKENQQIYLLLKDMLQVDPHRFGLTVDDFGAVAIEDLALAASRQIPWITAEHIMEISLAPHSDLIIEDDFVRFSAGYQFPVIYPRPVVPPLKLFIAINPLLVNSWRLTGAKPLLKRFLRLFASEDESWHFTTTVENITSPEIVFVAALKAHQAGIEFLQHERTYYCKFIPLQFLSF